MTHDAERMKRIEQVAREILEHKTSDPPWPEFKRDLAKKYDVTEEEVQETHERTKAGKR